MKLQKNRTIKDLVKIRYTFKRGDDEKSGEERYDYDKQHTFSLRMVSKAEYRFEFIFKDGKTVLFGYETGNQEERLICQDIEGEFDISPYPGGDEGMVQ